MTSPYWDVVDLDDAHCGACGWAGAAHLYIATRAAEHGTWTCEECLTRHEENPE